MGEITADSSWATDEVIIPGTYEDVELAQLTLEEINDIINPPLDTDLLGPPPPQRRTVELPGMDSPHLIALPDEFIEGPILGLMLDIGVNPGGSRDNFSLYPDIPVTQTTRRVYSPEMGITEENNLSRIFDDLLAIFLQVSWSTI